ncbi:uncharacterized protein LOC144108574 [Amblyomma americanum]
MEAAGVVSKVTEPTDWSSHMVTVIKNDKESVKYLGHVLTRDGLSLDPGRLEDIFHVQAPCNRKELQTFLGMVNFVSRFIRNMSTLTASLRELLKKNAAWESTRPRETEYKARDKLVCVLKKVQYT